MFLSILPSSYLLKSQLSLSSVILLKHCNVGALQNQNPQAMQAETRETLSVGIIIIATFSIGQKNYKEGTAIVFFTCKRNRWVREKCDSEILITWQQLKQFPFSFCMLISCFFNFKLWKCRCYFLFVYENYINTFS